MNICNIGNYGNQKISGNISNHGCLYSSGNPGNLLFIPVVINVHMLACKMPIFFFFTPVLIKIKFVAQILVIKFQKNLSRGSQVVPCGQMDRHDNANICF
jgi:hypothetical protein